MQNQGFSQSENELLKLKELVKSQDQKIQELNQSIANNKQFIEQLKEALLLAKAKRFGFSAELYLDTDNPQISLFDEAEVSSDESTEKSQETVVSTHTRKKNKGKRKALPDYLPRQTVEHRLSQDDLTLDNGLKYE